MPPCFLRVRMMLRTALIVWVKTLLLFVSALMLAACASQLATTESSASSVVQEPSAGSDRVEGFFIQPAVNFSRYEQMILTDINLRDIRIRVLDSKQQNQLNDTDRRFYRDQYIAAAVGHFIADGRYSTALDAGDNVLRMDAAIVEIAPIVVPESEHSAAMRAYLQGMAAMTIAIEVRDSLTNQLLATFTNTRNVGRIWDDHNRMVQSRAVSDAFQEWLAALRFYMDELTLPQ